MYKVRLWSVRHAALMEKIYAAVEWTLIKLAPLFEAIGYQRVEKPVAAIEKTVKGLLFDCQMCGQCALSSTGMSCPMNCPKTIRNGPCGGVRDSGMCEVKPDMRCVWVEALAGSQRMKKTDIKEIQRKPQPTATMQKPQSEVEARSCNLTTSRYPATHYRFAPDTHRRDDWSASFEQVVSQSPPNSHRQILPTRMKSIAVHDYLMATSMR